MLEGPIFDFDLQLFIHLKCENMETTNPRHVHILQPEIFGQILAIYGPKGSRFENVIEELKLYLLIRYGPTDLEIRTDLIRLLRL